MAVQNPALSLWRYGCWWQIADLLDEELALVDELLVICAVLEEMGQEVEELFAIHDEDFLYSDGLVWIGDKDLEDMKPLVLNHFSIVA